MNAVREPADKLEMLVAKEELADAKLWRIASSKFKIT